MFDMTDHPVWRFDDQMPEGREFAIFHNANTMPQPSVYQGHHFYEIYFILRGTVQVVVDDQHWNPVVGDTLIYPPQCMHRTIYMDPSVPYERFYIYLSKEYLEAVSTPEYHLAAELEKLTEGGSYYFRPGEQAVLELVKQADEIIDAARSTSPAEVLINRCRMTMFLVRLMGLLKNSMTSASECVPNRMNDLIRYINQNAAQPLSIDQLGQVFELSRSALMHDFKDYTGMSIYQYILTRRILLAQELIKDGAKPRQACLQSGFTDYASFYRVFKARTGKSPNQYGKSLNE